MIIELHNTDTKRLQRLTRALKTTDQNVISKALEALEQREQLRKEILKPAKGFMGISEAEANALYQIEEVRRTSRLTGVSINTVFDRYGAIRVFCGLHSIYIKTVLALEEVQAVRQKT